MDLYTELCSWDNLYLAWRHAARGKRGRGPAALCSRDFQIAF